MTYLERYRQGESADVWAELLGLGDAIRDEPLFTDAWDVARETMRRARGNVETIVSRLQRGGYVFRDPDSLGGPLEPPVAGTEGIVDELERLVGTMPLSLRAWYTVVGSASLRGAHPAWPAPPAVLPDPLEVTSPAIVLERCARWLDGMRPGDGYDWPDILIGGDGLHKAGYSGGPAYTIAVPNASVDGRLRGWYHEATFVDYLRICFAWGGFPGFARYDTRPTEMIAYLSQGLQPI